MGDYIPCKLSTGYQHLFHTFSSMGSVLLWITMLRYYSLLQPSRLISPILMTNDQLWKAALDQLQLRVSQGNFLTWFRNTKIRERDDERIVVETTSPFAYEWLSKKYRGDILEVLQNLDKTVSGVEFSINSQYSARRQLKKPIRIVAQKHKPLLPQPAQPAIAPTQSARVTTMDVPQFNPKYNFESYVVGSSNEIAYAACQAIAAKPGDTYNPLFIYGGVGLGKTHLLQAVGNAILKANPHFTVLYVSTEKFMNDFVAALQKGTTQQFKKFYRSIDVFIIDDVQFLAGKDKLQEELFHTFNSLHGLNKQVILSSDRPPTAIPTLQERLSSRLGAGMVVDIKKPDYETRLAILQQKIATKSITIDQEALEFIAKNVQNNVRELEGALNRVVAHCELHNQPATLDYTRKILSDVLDQSQRKTVGTKHIIEAVSTYYNLSSEDICGKCRKKEIVRPRQVAMYLLRKESSMSFPSIGEFFGGRDHTTAMHACDKIEKLLEHDEDLLQEINFLRERLYA